MIEVPSVFNNYQVLSITVTRKMSRVIVILFVVLCFSASCGRMFAQTAESGSQSNEENSHPSTPQTEEGLSSPEPQVGSTPEIVSETVDTCNGSWTEATGFGEKIDWIHMNMYNTTQDTVNKFDRWFWCRREEKQTIEPSRFRIGAFGEAHISKENRVDLQPLADFDADINLPNMERRLKLVLTTIDPTRLPGTDITDQQDTALRAALSRKWTPNVSTDIGVRARWLPELYAHAIWSTTWNSGKWLLYPEQKFYWEEEPGIGEISTLVLDHWKNRWNTRFSTAIKWSEQDRDDDHQNDRPDEGFRWSEVYLFGYATELLDESQLGRLVSGGDMARGWGLRLAVFGGFHLVDEYRAGVFYKWPLRKKWMYCFVGPDINWMNTNDWDREWTIKFGIEMLFWGGKAR